MAKHLGLKHTLHIFDMKELMRNLPGVVKILRVFDSR
jgi:asparagine synthetase B (glutamine-hydrolysing)